MYVFVLVAGGLMYFAVKTGGAWGGVGCAVAN